MNEYITGRAKESRISYEELEEVLRIKVQGFIQEILEEEVTAFLGRGKSERRKMKIDTVQSYRNGYGRGRRFFIINITLRVKYCHYLSVEVRNWERCYQSFTCMD